MKNSESRKKAIEIIDICFEKKITCSLKFEYDWFGRAINYIQVYGKIIYLEEDGAKAELSDMMDNIKKGKWGE